MNDSFGIIELWTNRLPLLKERKEEIQQKVNNIEPGSYHFLGPSDP